uniref:Lipid droplet-associated hydrolase n=1 Tax=Parascaris univalens TaxID=6257 RepID=A0A915BQ99_PARUN
MTWAIQRSVQWLRVAGRWTRISIMGFQLDENIIKIPIDGSDDRRTVILMIPGNPGNEGFYEYFAQEILINLENRKRKTLQTSSNQYIFYTISHLNHVRLPDELDDNDTHKSTDRFNVDDQIRHKIDFCLEYLPRTTRIIIFGHSIGSYIMLRLLSELMENKYNVVCAVALFPTIERMAESPNGQRFCRSFTV